MELKFTEIDNLGENTSNFDVNSYQNQGEKYWETANNKNTNINTNIKTNTEDKKKKRVNFDDILSNMNLIVNDKGVLQYMAPIKAEYQHQEELQVNNLKKIQQPQSNYKTTNIKPVDPQLKNSAIYNKYFKDYIDSNKPIEPEQKQPQTIEEYNQMLFESKMRQIQERNRISQIKSTKLLFTNAGNIQATNNKLYKMNFH